MEKPFSGFGHYWKNAQWCWDLFAAVLQTSFLFGLLDPC